MSTVIVRRGGLVRWVLEMRAKHTASGQARSKRPAESRPAPPSPGKTTSSNAEFPLSTLARGEVGQITRLNGIAQGRLRLLEMGLTPGTEVKVVRLAAFGGPMDVEVRGYQLSLRREEAAHVLLISRNEASPETT